MECKVVRNVDWDDLSRTIEENERDAWRVVSVVPYHVQGEGTMHQIVTRVAIVFRRDKAKPV